MAADKKTASELLILNDTVHLPYRADSGPILGAFFEEMKEKKIWANKCPQCGRMNIPPESYCGRCWGVKIGDDDWAEMADEGTLELFEIHYYESVHPFSGEKSIPIPWANGLFKLDGGWSIEHYIEPPDPEQHKIGDRYRAVWKEGGRTGSPFDIVCFKKIEDGESKKKKAPLKTSGGKPKSPVEPHALMTNFMVTYRHAAGVVGSKFFVELRDNKKIMATNCKKCNKVYMPPQSICDDCFGKIDDWVELSGKGTVTSYTVVHHAEQAQPVPTPFAYGIIQMDGADTGLTHLLGEVDLDKIHIGMRVEPVFKVKPVGNMLDIKYFRPAK